MKKTDIRFDHKTLELLKASIGAELECLRCDPFLFSNSVYGTAGIRISGKWLAFTNFAEVLDYYGRNEEVGVFKAFPVGEEAIRSYTGEKMIQIPVSEKITGIDVMNENQRLYKNAIQIYDVMLTRGVIFKLKSGRDLSLEKDVWLSEDINIERGEALIEKFTSTSEFCQNWENEYKGECTREIISLR